MAKYLYHLNLLHLWIAVHLPSVVSVARKQIEESNFDLNAVNPNAKADEGTRTPEQLLDLIEAKGREVAEAIAEPRRRGKE